MSIRIWNHETNSHEVSYVNRVLYLREINGYHDSDFIAGVWDDISNSVKEVEYATTRGWTHNNHANVDGDAETIEKYNAYNYRESVRKRWYQRQHLNEVCGEHGITRRDYRKLRVALSDDHLKACMTLLRTKKFRSSFRESLAKQVREWLTDNSPKFLTPLSRKQLDRMF